MKKIKVKFMVPVYASFDAHKSKISNKRALRQIKAQILFNCRGEGDYRISILFDKTGAYLEEDVDIEVKNPHIIYYNKL
jgi:hypothetical protein